MPPVTCKHFVMKVTMCTVWPEMKASLKLTGAPLYITGVTSREQTIVTVCRLLWGYSTSATRFGLTLFAFSLFH